MSIPNLDPEPGTCQHGRSHAFVRPEHRVAAGYKTGPSWPGKKADPHNACECVAADLVTNFGRTGQRAIPMDRHKRIAAGLGLLVFILLAAQAVPAFVGGVLMLGSILVLVFAIVGLVWPDLLSLPSRLAATGIFAVAFGMFVGGGMLINPPNGKGTASDRESTTQGRSVEEQIEADRRRHERRQAAPPVSGPAVGPGSSATVTLCHDFASRRVAGLGVRLDFPAFMDGARGAQHLGGTEYSFESYVDLIDGPDQTRLHYHCRVENGTVIAFRER